MDKILSKSKSMIFGRKKSKDDNTLRDSESFYDLDEYSFSSTSGRIQTPATGLKTKNPLPTKPFVQFAHASGPGPGERHGFHNSGLNPYSSRRDTQPVIQSRQKSLPIGRTPSTSDTNQPILSLNAHAGERYRLEVNFERGRTAPTTPSQSTLRNLGVSDQFHLTNTSKGESSDTRGSVKETKATARTSSCQLPDKSFRGCAISAPITNGLLSLETKFDPSTNRSNVQAFRSSADNVLMKHIPTPSATFSNRPGLSTNRNQEQNVSRETGPSGGGFSPLRGRRSLNFFNTAGQTSSSEISTTSPSNEKRNLSSLFPASSITQGSTTSGFSSSSDTHYGPLSNWVRYESQNNPRSECVTSKTAPSPSLNSDNDDRRPFHFRAASDNLTQLNPVQPLSLRSQPKMHKKKLDGFSDLLPEGNEKQNPSPNLYGSSVLQASASLPTPPTSTTTLSFIAGQLDIPEFDVDKGERPRLGFGAFEDGSERTTLARSDLESALKVQNAKLNELSEQVTSLTEQLNEETTGRKLFERRISHLENEIRGLRWIISEKDRVRRTEKGSEVTTVDSDSRGSSGQIASNDSSSRYEASRTSNTTEKDTTEKDKDKDRDEGGKAESGAGPRTISQHDPSGFNVTLKTTPNRRKRFGLALDLSPDSTAIGSASFRSSSQPRLACHHAGKFESRV